MEDCKYSQVCKFYGTTECYTDNDEENGCFREIRAGYCEVLLTRVAALATQTKACLKGKGK